MQGKYFIAKFSLIASKCERANPFHCASELLFFIPDRKLQEKHTTERKVIGDCLIFFSLIYFVTQT